MKPLEDMTFGQRAALTVVICLAILFALALFGYLTGRWDEADAAPLPVLSPYEARLIELDREAIDNAYRTKLEQLFSVWLKDDTDQPSRAVVGANQARKAYTGAVANIERRKAALNSGGR